MERKASWLQAFVRQKACENASPPVGHKVLWSRHAIAKLVIEGLSRTVVEEALREAEVIEVYPMVTRPLPDGLVLIQLEKGHPLHAVVAVDESNDRVFVVTIYTPDPDRWNHDFRTRRR